MTVFGGTSILGGVTLKFVSPDVQEALMEMFEGQGIDISGSLTTFYRVDIHGTVFYSRQYQRVKKRNSYTIAYHHSASTTKYAFIEYFVYVQERVIAILTPLKPLHIACQDHFHLTTDALDKVLFLVPVEIESSVCVCFVEDIKAKCLFLNFHSSNYVVLLPATILFD